MFQQKHSLLFQILFGILCGILNRFFEFFCALGVPLYLDTIFTVSASLFGIVSGIISIVVFHLFSPITFNLEPYQPSTLFFSICSLTMVFIIHYFTKNEKKLDIGKIIILILIITFVVAIEGGIIYVFVFKQFNYQESTQAKYITYALLRQNVSIIVASILPRIPLGLVDKSISVIVGYYFAVLVQKIKEKNVCARSKKLNESK